MKLGVYTAVLHDKPLADALAAIADLGLTSAEINSGGFVPSPHLPIEAIRSSQDARDEYLAEFEKAGVTLTALNCNGNPLHPNPAVGPRQAQDIRDSIEIAALLGVKRVVTMSGTPANSAAGTLPAWTVLPWESSGLDARDYQWSVAVPFWKQIQAQAADADVKVCLEMHPGNIVYNPNTMIRLATEINATHVGAEMDPSHLFWQGMDPTEATKFLGDLVYNAAAKDTRINPAALVNGVLDDTFSRAAKGEPGYLEISVGGDVTLSVWPKNPSWDFVAVGRGHDQAWWTGFLAALADIDPEMAVNIEHEDQELGQLEGLASAAKTLIAAAAALPTA